MKKIILSVLIILGIGTGIWGYKYYKSLYGSNTKKSGYILISKKDANLGYVLQQLEPYLINKEAFEKIAVSKNLEKNIKPGRYFIDEKDNNTRIVNMLKAGLQTEDDFRFIAFDDVYQMIGRVTKKTEMDSIDFVKSFDSIARSKGLKNAEDLKPYFSVDTHRFFWTITPEDFFKKFENDYNKFWNEERKEKERQSGLSRNQIYALASIVYKESGGKLDEQKTIAGLYLNRYRKGMKLQSDPTVIYAINKENNFSHKIKRVYYKHLRYDSPYNTYANAGIPPGPICLVDYNVIDAVLNAEKNNYIYMCADPKKKGFHKFTNSDTEHAINAKAYQDWLNSSNIK